MPAFFISVRFWLRLRRRLRDAPASRKNIFCDAGNFHRDGLLCGCRAGGQTNMRAFAFGLIFSVLALPCLAQTIRKSEPFILAPY